MLTSFFVLEGYLLDVGMHVRNLQRSVNDMEELVALEKQPLGVDDRPGAGELRVTAGEIRFEDVTFRYGRHEAPLYDGFSVRIAPGERVGLVGHSGSGKTTFIKLIQRLYDVNGGRITIDGQDIAQVKQASLRGQIAIVQQEPVLFHRTLAENIAYARPGATQAEIEQAARLASAHDFIMAVPGGYGASGGALLCSRAKASQPGRWAAQALLAFFVGPPESGSPNIHVSLSETAKAAFMAAATALSCSITTSKDR